MQKKGLSFVIIFLVIFSISLISSSGFYSNNYLIQGGSERFLIDTSNLQEQELNLVLDSLSSLLNSNDIKSYNKINNNIIVDFDNARDIKIEMNNNGLFITKQSDGYIIELQSPSIIEKTQPQTDNIKQIKKQIKSEKDLYTLEGLRERLNDIEQETKEEANDYKQELQSEHEAALEDINNRLENQGLSSLNPFTRLVSYIKGIFGITGNVISEINIQETQEFYNVFNGVVLDISKEEINQIKDSKYIKNIYANREVKAVLFDSVPMINAEDLWELDANAENCTESGLPCLNGQGITIAIIDTGIDYTHSDLGGCFGEGCKVIGGYDFVNEDDDPMDDQGHGTHCAGIAAADGDLKGVAPKAKLYAYKVLDSGGSGSDTGVIAGIERATDPNNDGNFSDHVDVMSLSLGGWGDPDDPVSLAIDRAVDLGAIAVVAAGNEGPWEASIGSPGCARNALTVGAICKDSQIGVNGYCDEQIASFSSRGPVIWQGGALIKPDVVAPGVEICSTQWGNAWTENECLDNEHTAISGTSMATPHVAGAAALIRQANPELSAIEIKSLIETSSIDLGFDVNTQGNGNINLLNALNSKILFSQSKLDFGNIKGESTSKIITIKNRHNESITIDLSADMALNKQTNEYYDLISFNDQQIIIPANSEYELELNLQLPSEVDGTFSGKVILTENEIDSLIPYSVSRVSELTLKVNGDHYPNFYIYNNETNYVQGANQDRSFVGNEYTFLVPHGQYNVYVINDFLGWGETQEYILVDIVDVPVDSQIDKTFTIEDAKLFTVKARSKEDKELSLAEWTKGFVVYPDGSIIGDYSEENLIPLSVGFYDPIIGDRDIYLSNNPNPNLNVDITLKYLGVPVNE